MRATVKVESGALRARNLDFALGGDLVGIPGRSCDVNETPSVNSRRQRVVRMNHTNLLPSDSRLSISVLSGDPPERFFHAKHSWERHRDRPCAGGKLAACSKRGIRNCRSHGVRIREIEIG